MVGISRSEVTFAVVFSGVAQVEPRIVAMLQHRETSTWVCFSRGRSSF